MKIKSIIKIFAMINGLLIGGMVYGDDPMKSPATTSTSAVSSEGMGWQEQTQRTATLISDGIRITTGPAVGTNGLSWSIGLSSNYNIIDCCKP
jgi:hypothetical protein